MLLVRQVDESGVAAVDDKLLTAVGTLFGLVAAFVAAGLLADAPSLTSNVNVALLLMIIVVIAAAIGGRLAGALSAVGAALSYDFFQTEPVHSLRIHSHNDIETAVLLLVAGLIVGQIAARAQLLGATVATGRSELTRLRRLADLVARGATSSEVVDAAAEELTQLLSLRSCRFETPPFGETLPRLERTGVVPRPTGMIVWRRAGRQGLVFPDEGVELLVLHRGAEVGRFVLVSDPGEGSSLEQRVVAVALADQVGAALGEDESPGGDDANTSLPVPT